MQARIIVPVRVTRGIAKREREETRREAERLETRTRVDRLLAEIDARMPCPNPLRCESCNRYRPRYDTTCRHCGWRYDSGADGDPGDRVQARSRDGGSPVVEIRAAGPIVSVR